MEKINFIDGEILYASQLNDIQNNTEEAVKEKLAIAGGTMSGAITTKGIILIPNVDFFDSLPSTVIPNKLIFVKVE